MTTALPARVEPPRADRTAAWLPADVAAAHTLLGCVVRELAMPAGRARPAGPFLLITLPHSGVLLRARLRRTSTVGGHRFSGPVQHRQDRRWSDVDTDRLAELVAAELDARTGCGNAEFTGQVRASRDALADLLARRPVAPARPVAGPAAGYLDSEQSLLAGHPRHPAPKWRSGELAAWRRYAPEGRTAFPLRWLAVRTEFVRDHGSFDTYARCPQLVGAAARGHRLVPVHPWQFRLLSTDPVAGPALAAAVADGVVRDLGEVGLPLHPTASVRTLYQPELDLFLKTSLNVRITNCVRRNADYELAGSVALTSVLAEPVAAVAAQWPGFGVLAEPAARGVLLPQRYGDPGQRKAVLEGLGCIVRAGVTQRLAPGEQVHLAGALAAAAPDPARTRTRLADLAGPAADGVSWAREWWRRYVGVLAGPVLALWAQHGIVLEPHLQNVLVVVGQDGMPRRVLARDLEGTKLVAGRHRATLAALPGRVARACGYDEERAWQRVAYCLLVNHLAEIAGALADLAQASAPGMCRFEDELWATLGSLLADLSGRLGDPPRLRAALAGEALPAKANLLVRWARDADRMAGYVPLASPWRR